MPTSTLFPLTVPTLPSADYGTSTGSGAAYAVLPTSIARVFSLIFNVTSTSAPTLAVGPGGTPFPLLNGSGVAIVPGEIIAGEERIVVDNIGSYTIVGFNRLSVPQLFPFTASCAGNVLTVGLNPTRLQFRSTTLTNGLPIDRFVGTALSLAVPNLAILGTINAISARLSVLLLDVSATVQELAIVNPAGLLLDESGVINTTVLNTSSAAAGVAYSATARTGVAYRVVGFLDISQATAGTWASQPTLVVGGGGQAATVQGTFGFGQTCQSPTRVANTTYYNTTSKPILCSVTIGTNGSNGQIQAVVNGANAGLAGGQAAVGNGLFNVTFVVPIGGSYSAVTGVGIAQWSELR